MVREAWSVRLPPGLCRWVLAWVMWIVAGPVGSRRMRVKVRVAGVQRLGARRK